MFHKDLIVAMLLLTGSAVAQSPSYRLPSGDEFAKVVPGGTTVLPNGRHLTPVGERLYTGDDLWNVVPSPDGKLVIGFCDPGIVIYPSEATTAKSNSYRIPWRNAAFCGVFTKDGTKLITSSGDVGHGIQIFETSQWYKPASKRMEELDEQPKVSIKADAEAYINDIAVSSDGRFVYGADVARQRIVVFDIMEEKVVADIPAGREPFSIAISEDEQRLFVANIGVFDYSLVPKGEGDKRGLTVPAFGFPSKESEEGVFREGRQVPGLGDPLVPDAHSVWMFDVTTPGKPVVSAKVKTGILIHAPADGGKAVGGSSPNALLVSKGTLFVTNANNDTVQYIDAKTLEIRKTIKLAPEPTLASLRGVIPSGMCITSDGAKLYVCASGLNAVAVIDVASGRSRTGFRPVGSQLLVDYLPINRNSTSQRRRGLVLVPAVQNIGGLKATSVLDFRICLE